MARRIGAAWMAALSTAVMLVGAGPRALAAGNVPARNSNQPVTLTGCLHADGRKFILTDLSGDQAPKGRSWKTGFILKTTKDVEVVGASSSLKLKDQVGRQISVVGVKDGDTRLKAQSIKRVAASCS